MQAVELYALAIDQVRDIFGANDQLAGELREVAARAFPAPRLRRFAYRPLMRRDPAFALNPGNPHPEDVDALLAGGFVAPERLPACWQLLRVFLDHLAPARLTAIPDATLLDGIEFDLARAGLSSDFALRRLAERPLQIPLRPLPGQLAGYSKHRHAHETGLALREVLIAPVDQQSTLTAETRSLVAPVADFLADLPDGTDAIVVGH